jgi:hypothetical protein
VRAGNHLLGALLQAADLRIAEKRIAAQGGVVLQAHMDGQPLGEQNLRGHAVRVPGVPSLRQALLHSAIVGGARRRSGQSHDPARSYRRRRRGITRLRPDVEGARSKKKRQKEGAKTGFREQIHGKLTPAAL